MTTFDIDDMAVLAVTIATGDSIDMHSRDELLALAQDVWADEGTLSSDMLKLYAPLLAIFQLVASQIKITSDGDSWNHFTWALSAAWGEYEADLET